MRSVIKTQVRPRILLVLLLAPLCLGLSGCNGSSADDGAGTPASSGTNQTDSSQSSDGTMEHFPDGLHPDGVASDAIAAAFNDALGGTPAAATDPNLIVCLGDSITAAGYPDALAARSGKGTINAGHGGEESGGGAARVGSLLAANNPGYLCILYGANDIHSHLSLDSVINNLAAIVHAAQAKGTVPILGTLTPMSGPRFGVYQATVEELNNRIRAYASGAGVRLADVAAEF
ncbi:MAG: GDSL-type esterase/lipase family protein [Kiritimatiellaeota bacterium]|nr:GDSL-type esterase/lipase family protein [Kiritimatiellota bacterium]